MWGVEKIQKWQGLLSEKMDTAENMIAPSLWLHKLWGKRCIGFQPFEKLENGGVKVALGYLKHNLLFKTAPDPDIFESRSERSEPSIRNASARSYY